MYITITESPSRPPRRCVQCGTNQSEFFVDTGINLELHFNTVVYGDPGLEGAIYLCAACWENLVREGSRQVAQFIEVINGSNVQSDRPTVEDSGTAESDDPEPTSGDSESDSIGSDEAFAEFNDFFANRGG